MLSVATHFTDSVQWFIFLFLSLVPPIAASGFVLSESLDETSKTLLPLFSHCSLALFGMATGFHTYMVNASVNTYIEGE